MNNTIVGNFADFGGGGVGCADFSAPVIAGNIFTANSTNERGGGINCSNSNPTISNNTISGNSAEMGGGIRCYESSPTLINNTISGNSADVSGGGIYCELVSNPVITNTIFWADSAAYSTEIDFDDSSSPYFTYCDIQGGWGGEGNIDTDPLFRDPENGDFHLMADSCGDVYNSPCIDAGDPAIFDSTLGCDWGLGTILSDMGAYGGGDSVMVGIDDYEVPVPKHLALVQNYPNPFNAATIIRYTLPEPADVKIEIFDVLGRGIKMLVEEEQMAGYHQVVWDAKSQSSGIYFYKIQAGNYTGTKKMVLLK